MINRIIICIISLCFFSLFSCKKNTDYKSSSISKENKKIDTLEVIYYQDKKVKELFLSEYENEKNVKLFFYENGKLERKVLNFNSYPQNNYEYNQNGKLIHHWKEGDIGGCIATIGREVFWDDKGNISKEVVHTNSGESCSEKILIHEIKEYFSGTKKIKSIKNTRESYEGSNECPCGFWKEYDENEKIISQNTFTECSNTNISCEDDDIQNEKSSISDKWIGRYELNLIGKGNRTGNEYQIYLDISKDSIAYTAEGYQLYHKFLLTASDNGNELYLKYTKPMDDTNSWALEKTKDFGKITIKNGKYLWESPFLNTSYTDNKKIIYTISKKN